MRALVFASVLAAGVLLPAAARAEDDFALIPIVRVSGGADFTVAPDAAKSIEGTAAVGAGVDLLFAKSPVFVVAPEAGYTYDAGGGGAHLFDIACGLGVGDVLAYVAYRPHFLVGGGGDGGGVAIGTRQGIALHALFDIFSLEAGYQLMSREGEARHSVYLITGVNPAAALQAILGLAFASAR